MANTYTDKLNLRVPGLGDTSWHEPLNDDLEIMDTTVAPVLAGNVVLSGCVPSDGGVLTVDYTAGAAVVAGTEYAISSGSEAATISSKNWLYVDDAGAVQISTAAPTGDFVLLALADADATALTNVADLRNMAEGAAALDIGYTPDNYAPDTSESKEIEQHLAGIDTQIGVMGAFKNKLINGGFDIWQRGTSQTTPGYGSDDRWKNVQEGTTFTNSRQTFDLGQTDVPGNPKYFARTVITHTVGADHYFRKQQHIEGVQTFAGQTATLSFWAKADASKKIGVCFSQAYGSGGTPSTQTFHTDEAVNFDLTTAWQKFSHTVTLPSISGKTLGTNNNDYLRVELWYNAGSDSNDRTDSMGHQSGTFDLAQVQLEAGEVATPFEHRPMCVELLLAFRYYCILSYSENMGYCNRINYTSDLRWQISFPVEMAQLPHTITITSISETGSAFNGVGVGDITVPRIGLSGLHFNIQATASTSSGTRSYVQVNATVDAEI